MFEFTHQGFGGGTNISLPVQLVAVSIADVVYGTGVANRMAAHFFTDIAQTSRERSSAEKRRL